MKLPIKTPLLLFLVLCTSYFSTQAQLKQVLYVNQTGVDPGNNASPPENDAVIRMLKADGNFEVTYIETPQDGSRLPELSAFDLIIAQESLSSGAAVLKPGGKLGIKDVTVPIIYCKSSAFRDGRAISDADAVAVGTQNLFLTVLPENQSHPLFRGISFAGGNEVRITFHLTNNSGSDPGAKAIDIVNNISISTPGTLLGTVAQVSDREQAIAVNYFPAGTQLGDASSDQLQVDAIALSFGYGPLVYQNGSNISNEALTMWRNAAYLLTGMEVPDQLYYNPALTKKILYVNQQGIQPAEGAATPGYDPVLRMLEFEDFFEVTYVQTNASGSQIPDLSDFDLLVIQQSVAAEGTLFKPGGKLSLQNISIPAIFNQTAAFTQGNAVNDADAEAVSSSDLFVSVSRAAQRHTLFNGISFTNGNDIQVLSATAGNDGSVNGDRALETLRNIHIENGGLLLANLPGAPSATETLVVNYLPAGTQLGESESGVVQANTVVLPFNYGALTRENGAALTNEGLTLWRNAAYLLTDLPVPTELCSSPALTKQVLYLNQKGVDPGNTGASEPGNDPITRMLDEDPNFKVTYVETYTGGQQIPDPQLYDLVIAQETLSSGSSFFQPGGKLAPGTIKAPIIYNKASVFRDGRAVSESDVTVHDTQNLSLTVPSSQQGHSIFSGINFTPGNELRIFKTTASTDGAPGGGKAMEVVNNLDISTEESLLATVPEITQATQGVVLNYFPAGTQLGTSATDRLQVDAMAFAMSYGALVAGDGANISSEGLTIWRNAAYRLTGLEVPNHLYVNEDFVVSISDVQASDVLLSCSPNPTSTHTFITVNGQVGRANLSLYSINGKLLWEHTLTGTGQHRIPLTVSGLQNGMYLLKLSSETHTSTLKVVKR